jgi:hypothetical protein
MITGVQKEKHNVLTEDFAGNALATYPPIFQRIKSVKPTFRTAVFSASAAFKNNLTTGAAVSEGFSSDDALKTRMVDFLKTDTAQIVVGEFAGIEAAGNAVGFDDTFPAYKTAIETFDTQVGAILTAVKNRPTYDRENWMIIVTSNRGGVYDGAENDGTIFSNTNSNTFTIIATDTYNQTFLAKPFLGNQYTGTAPRFKGYPEKGIGQVNAEKSTYFNFGDTSGFTISVKVKKHKNPINVSRGDYYYNWPGFVGKRGNSATNSTPQTGWGNSNGPGWDFCLFQNGWRFLLSGVGSFKGGKEMAGLNFTGDTWHDLTAVVERKPDGSTVTRVYTDGVMAFGNNNGSGAITTGPYSTTPFVLAGPGAGTDVNLDSNSPLRIGYTPGEQDGENGVSSLGKIDVDIKELKIFKAAIPDAIVKEYACDQTIDVSHPYYAYLVGYWPMGEGSGATIADKGPLGADFTLSQAKDGGYSWEPFSDLICSPVATNLALTVPKNADIPVQILSWLNISRQSSWGLDGKVWITN